MNLSQANRLADMALEMSEQPDLPRTLHQILASAQSSIACDAAGVLLVSDRGQAQTAAASDEVVRRADELQRAHAEGPTVPVRASSRTADSVVLVRNTQHDERFPQWGARVAALGFQAVLVIHLFTPVRTVGAVNLYGRARDAFGQAEVDLAQIFGRHASVALVSAQYGDSLRAAVESRHLIGQAQGILMERYQLDADGAFDVLRRYSQHKNIKLRVIAEQVVTSHRLPD